MKFMNILFILSVLAVCVSAGIYPQKHTSPACNLSPASYCGIPSFHSLPPFTASFRLFQTLSALSSSPLLCFIVSSYLPLIFGKWHLLLILRLPFSLLLLSLYFILFFIDVFGSRFPQVVPAAPYGMFPAPLEMTPLV